MAPKPTITSPHGVDDLWLSSGEKVCFQDIQAILVSSRKDTRATYVAQWRNSQSGLNLISCHQTVQKLDYLLYLKSSGLSISSVRGNFGSISVIYPPPDVFPGFSHPLYLDF